MSYLVYSCCVLNSLFPFPYLELFSQVLFQTSKLVPKVFAAPPAYQVALQVAFSTRVSSLIIWAQRKVLDRYKERCGEAVVVLPVPHTLVQAIFGDDVNMEVVH